MFAERMTRLPWRRLGLIAGVYLLAVAIGVLPAWQRFDPTQLLVAVLVAALGIVALLAWFRASRFEYIKTDSARSLIHNTYSNSRCRWARSLAQCWRHR